MTTPLRKALLISVPDDRPMLDQLGEISGWSVEPLGIAGSFENCLTNGHTRIALHLISAFSCMTTNVLPHDHEHDISAANLAIDELAASLASAGIAFGDCSAEIVA